MTLKNFKLLFLLFVGLMGPSAYAAETATESTSSDSKVDFNYNVVPTTPTLQYGNIQLVEPNTYSLGPEGVFQKSKPRPSLIKSMSLDPFTEVTDEAVNSTLSDLYKADWWEDASLAAKDSSVFKPENLGCSPETSDPLNQLYQSTQNFIKVADATDSTVCYDHRKSFTRNDDNLSEKELLESDLYVCSCLRSHNFAAVRDAMSMNLTPKKVDQGKTLQKGEEELKKILGAFTFQASSLQPAVQSNVTDKSKSNFALSYVDQLYSNLQPKIDERLLSDKLPYPDGQCVSPRSFFEEQQWATPGIIDELVKGPVNFDNWNYHKLQNDYQQLMKLSTSQKMENGNRKKITALKEKLLYLNRNPMIKYALGAPLSDALKKDLFHAMVTNKPRACATGASLDGCNEYNKRAFEVLKLDLAEFFTRSGEIHKFVREEARKDHEERLASQAKKSLSQKKFIEELQSSYNLPTPDSCEKDTPEPVRCLEIHSAYCQILDKHKNDIYEMPEEDAVLDDLEERMAQDFNPDLATNEEFKKYNKKHCGPRTKKPGFIDMAKAMWSKNTPEPVIVDFTKFVEMHCKDKEGAGECKRDDAWDYHALQKKFNEEYPYEFNERRHKLGLEPELAGAASLPPPPEIPAEDRRDLTNGEKRKFDPGKLFARLKESLTGQSSSAIAPKTESDGPFLGGVATGLNHLANSMNSQNEQTAAEEAPMNYSNVMENSTVANNQPSEPKIENMSNEKRQELLEEWQKEYDSLKEKKGEGPNSVGSAEAQALKTEIATLKALLEQQQQLTQEQYKLLNEAIKSKNKSPESGALAKAEEAQGPAAKKQTSNLSAKSDDDVSRAPASVKEAQFNTAGAQSGAAAAASSVTKRTKGTSARVGDSSADSVAREEAKLVNMRKNTDGSITIQSVSTGSQVANAITVPVSDEQYRMLQSNPASLNLSQLEKNIPKDQIAKLEKNGEIIILLKNGSNPPFEVKVEKKDDKLVYSLKDKNGKEQAPVKRVFTRQALEQELKVQR